MAFHTSHTSHPPRRPRRGAAAAGSLETYATPDENPLLADALVSQLGLSVAPTVTTTAPAFNDGAVRGGFGGAARQLPNPDDPAVAMRRFQQLDVIPRAEVCRGQLMANVEVSGAAGTIEVAHFGTGGRQVMVTLIRPDYEAFNRHLRSVQKAQKDRPTRAAEILSQIEPAEAVWSSIAGLSVSRHRWTLEALGIALDMTTNVVYRCKQLAACPRPVEYSPQIQPLIQTPGHDSWPSGHSTESHVVARILTHLMGLSLTGTAIAEAEKALVGAAIRIAHNREVAGVHFFADSLAGYVLGDTLGRYFISVAEQDSQPSWKPREYDSDTIHALGSAFDALNPDASAFATFLPTCDRPGAGAIWTAGNGPAPAAQHAYVQQVWKLAKAEWT